MPNLVDLRPKVFTTNFEKETISRSMFDTRKLLLYIPLLTVSEAE